MFKNIKLALEKSRKKFQGLTEIFGKAKISENDILMIEEMLVESDIGYGLCQEILNILRKTGVGNLKNILIKNLSAAVVDCKNHEPIVFIIVGVLGINALWG